MLNTANYGKDYKHYWTVGFGELLADRIYYVNMETGTRTIYRVPNYHFSEPVFLSPKIELEDENRGVIASTASPLNPSDRAFIVFLAASCKSCFYLFSKLTNFFPALKEIARFYFPKDFIVPISFHGIFYKTEELN